MQLRPATERKQQALVESNRQRRWFSVLLFVLLSFLVFFATALRDSGPHDKGLLSLCSCLEFHIRIQILQAEWVDMTWLKGLTTNNRLYTSHIFPFSVELMSKSCQMLFAAGRTSGSSEAKKSGSPLMALPTKPCNRTALIPKAAVQRRGLTYLTCSQLRHALPTRSGINAKHWI